MSIQKQRINPRDNTAQATGDSERHSDADSIRRAFSISPADLEAFDYPSVYPNFLKHTWEGAPRGATRSKGGTDFLATAKPGGGKSTLGLFFAERLMEVNNETIVWRGSPSRSEWLPLAPWTTLCLPRNVDVSARLEPKDPTRDVVEVDVEEMCRDVKRYSNPVHLNREVLEPGQFHVVYPDPRMQDCQAFYEDSSIREPGLEFTPDDPLNHWWFAWFLCRVEFGPHGWMTAIIDEIGDLVPESAADDEFATLPKIKALVDSWVDFRKYGLTVGMFGHTDIDIHNKLRHKIRWRIALPGSANPTSAGPVVGFESVPMKADIMSRENVGTALMYTESNFEKFRWPDFPAPISRKLKISLEGA